MAQVSGWPFPFIAFNPSQIGGATSVDPALQINNSSAGDSVLAFGGVANSNVTFNTAGFNLNINGNNIFQSRASGSFTNLGYTLQTLASGSFAPSATCSGGSVGVSIGGANATNNQGTLTTSSTASTSCTMTFNAQGTWFAAPVCVWSSHGAVVAGLANGNTTTSQAVVVFSSAVSQLIDYMCI
jgi:hypothetical protein